MKTDTLSTLSQSQAHQDYTAINQAQVITESSSAHDQFIDILDQISKTVGKITRAQLNINQDSALSYNHMLQEEPKVIQEKFEGEKLSETRHKTTLATNSHNQTTSDSIELHPQPQQKELQVKKDTQNNEANYKPDTTPEHEKKLQLIKDTNKPEQKDNQPKDNIYSEVQTSPTPSQPIQQVAQDTEEIQNYHIDAQGKVEVKTLQNQKNETQNKQELKPEQTQSSVKSEQMLELDVENPVIKLKSEIERNFNPKNQEISKNSILIASLAQAFEHALLKVFNLGANSEIHTKNTNEQNIKGVSSLNSTQKLDPKVPTSNSSQAGLVEKRQDLNLKHATESKPEQSRHALFKQAEKVDAVLSEVAKSKDGKNISLKVEIPDFGKFKVEVGIKDTVLHARIITDSGQNTAILRENIGELQNALKKLGLKVDTISLSLGSVGEEFAHLVTSDSNYEQSGNFSQNNGQDLPKFNSQSKLQMVNVKDLGRLSTHNRVSQNEQAQSWII